MQKYKNGLYWYYATMGCGKTAQAVNYSAIELPSFLTQPPMH